jgi:hypothetical protein
MATENHEEDLSEREGDDVIDRVRELMDSGWQPVTLHLRRETGPDVQENPVLRDDVHL